eukprot:5474078-Karenia_brevis.AAC.1
MGRAMEEQDLEEKDQGQDQLDARVKELEYEGFKESVGSVEKEDIGHLNAPKANKSKVSNQD